MQIFKMLVNWLKKASLSFLNQTALKMLKLFSKVLLNNILMEETVINSFKNIFFSLKSMTMK